MSDKALIINNQLQPHFLTFAVVGWVDVFTKKLYRDIVIDSLKFCQKEAMLNINGWCIMSNHLHLILTSLNGELSKTLGRFKTYTSKRILAAIENNERERRRDWMLNIFRQAGEVNSRNKNYQFWQQNNCPKELYSSEFSYQKLNYIHNNPVAAGIVERPEHYLFSSAKDYFFGKKCGLLDITYL